MTISDLIDYLGQFEPGTRVFSTEADVDEPCEFIALDSIVAAYAKTLLD